MVHERIVFEDDEYGRLLVAREPAPDLEVWRGCGPERGAWEDEHRAGAVTAEYEPPQHGRAA